MEYIPPVDNTISAELLKRMGLVPEDEKLITVHSDLVSIWSRVLKDGLTKEVKDELIKSLPQIRDCQTSAPSLNPEIKATISAKVLKRDNHLSKKQSQMGHVICGLGEIVSKNLTEGNMEMVEKISNCIRLLCDIHHMESETRRELILPGLDREMKNSLGFFN